MNDQSNSAEMTTSSRRRTKRWLVIAATTVLVPILVLGVVEAGLRVADVGYPTQLLVPCTVKGRPASCYNLFFAAPYFPPGMIQTPRPYWISPDKPENTYRIFVLGESAAMGDPDPAYGFSRYLEVMLRQRYPSTKFEVVNTGSVAINSHVILPIAEQLAQQRPDLFIIYSGNNEVVGPYGPGTALASAWGMQLPVVRTSMFLRATRIGQVVTKLGSPKQEWRGMELFLDKQIPANSPLMKYSYANFERNLKDTIGVARRAGTRVIVSTVATNVRDCPPFASLHRQGLGKDAIDSWTALVEKGVALEDAGSYPEALKAYQAAESIDSDYAELHYRIARIHEALGNYLGAQDRYARARDLDTLRFRADSRINEINRSIAASTPGVDLVDANAILSGASEHGVIGSDLVFEHVHLTPKGNYLMASAIFEKIAASLPAAPENSAGSIPSQTECERLLGFTKFDQARIAADVLQRIQKPPFTNQMNHSDQVMRLSTLAQQMDELPDETVAQYQWAIERNPNDPMLHYKFGMFLFRYDKAAAAEQLRMARPWDGFPVSMPDGRMLRE